MPPAHEIAAAHGAVGPRSLLAALGAALLVAALTVGIPLLLADLSARTVLGLTEIQEEQRRFGVLERSLQRLAAVDDPEVLLLGGLRHLVRSSMVAQDAVASMAEAVAGVVRRFPGACTALVFDDKQRLVAQHGGLESRTLAERLCRRLVAARIQSRVADVTDDPLLESFLGLARGDARGQTVGAYDWCQLSDRPRKTFFFHHLDPRASLFVFVHAGDLPPLAGLRRALPRFRTRSLRVDLADVEAADLIDCDEANYRARARVALQRMLAHPVARARDERALWAIHQVSPDRLLLASTPFVPAESRQRVVRALWAVGGVLMVGVTLVAWRRWTVTPPPFMSISWKLLGIFQIVGGVPLLCLFMLAGPYVREQYNILLSRAERHGFAVLDELEERFPQTRLHFERQLNREVDRHRRRGGVDISRLATDVARILAASPYRGLTVINTAGTSHVVVPVGARGEGKSHDFLRKMLRFVLRRARGEMRPEDRAFLLELGVQPGDVDAGQADSMLDDLLGNDGHLMPFFIGRGASNLLVRQIGRRGQPPEALVAAQWTNDDLEFFFRRRFVPFRPLADGTELMVVETAPHGRFRPVRAGALGWPEARRCFAVYPGRVVPPALPSLFHAVRRARSPATAVATHRGARVLVCGRPGKTLAGSALFAILPLAAIDGELRGLVNRFRIFVGFSLLFSVLLGMLLTRRCLRPVHEIAEVVAAVASEQFSRRIVVRSTDELGEFAAGFNRMVERIEEASVARRIQAGLIPRQGLATDCWQVDLARSVRAGSDYHDCLVTPDRRVLAVHAALGGHGIAAALVMAMVKGVFDHCGASETPVRDVVAAVVDVVRHHGSGIDLRLQVIEAAGDNGRVCIYNCNHSPAVVVRRDASWEWVPSDRTIAGRDRPEFTPHVAALDLGHGERLFTVTPGGLVPSREKGNSDVGTAWRRFASRQRAVDLSSACRQFLCEFAAEAAKADPDSSLSILGLARQGGDMAASTTAGRPGVRE